MSEITHWQRLVFGDPAAQKRMLLFLELSKAKREGKSPVIIGLDSHAKQV